MPRSTVPLTAAKIRAENPGAKPFKLVDGGGLYLRVLPSGVRTWRLDYKLRGAKLRTLTIGRYPDVSLADAREARSEAKRLIAKGIDPAEAKQAAAQNLEAERMRLKQLERSTVDAVARRWLSSIKPGMSPVTHGRIRGRIENHVLPVLGGKQVAEVTRQDVLACVRAVQDRGTIETGKRLLNYAKRIFEFAEDEGLLTANPAEGAGRALKRAPAVQHRARLDITELPDFLAAFERSNAAPETKAAMNLVLFCWARTGEVRFAEWREIEDLDGSNPLWRIPAARMKMRREHIVPLTPPAVAALKVMQKLTGKQRLIFAAGTKSGTISENRLLNLIDDCGWGGRATTHGFRGLASTTMHERGWSSDLIERQLAHTVSAVRRAYDSSTRLAERRELLEAWAAIVEQARADGELRAAIG